ncbi:MAG TPA: hypothetical protein VGJ15_04090, partial [Pirellulales bacterium]
MRKFTHRLRAGQSRRIPTPALGSRRTVIEPLEKRRLLTLQSLLSGGSLTIDLDGADNVSITKVGGLVKINGQDPLGGPIATNALVGITLSASGNFDNHIDLTAINQTDFSSLVLISLDAGDGNDVYQLNQGGLVPGAVVQVADTGAVGSDSLELSSSALVGETINISATDVSRSLSATVSYDGIESLQVDGTSAADTINVTATNASTATSIQAGGGVDVFSNIDLTQIGTAGLSIDGGGNGESLTLNTTT